MAERRTRVLSWGALLVVAACGDASTSGRTALPASADTNGGPTPTPTAGTAEPAPPAPAPAPAPDDDLGAAQAFVRNLTLGVNVERGWAWSLPGQDATGSTSYWTYLRDTAHVTHVRLFCPWRPSIAMGGGGANNAPPDKAAFARILDAADQAIKAGLTVFLDCTDVMGTEDFEGENGKRTDEHMGHCADWTAERAFDEKRFALGPVNEWAGGEDNDTYNATRLTYHDVLRAKLPGYVLTTGPGYWKSRDWLYDADKKFKTFSDLRVVYEWHHYSSLDEGGWKSEAEKLAAWRKENGGRPTVCGEAGPGYWDEIVNGKRLAQAPEAWPARFAAQLPAIAEEHPSVWAVTYGGEYRINKNGDDPFLQDGLVTTFVKAEAAMRTKLGL